MSLVVSGLTTTGLANGDVGYVSSANTMTKTNAAAAASARAYGVNNGIAGEMQVEGSFLAKFTTAGGSPSAGAAVFLAPSTEEAGAAGKLTATAPTTSGQFVAQVGICQTNATYAGAKTATILWQPKTVIAL